MLLPAQGFAAQSPDTSRCRAASPEVRGWKPWPFVPLYRPGSDATGDARIPGLFRHSNRRPFFLKLSNTANKSAQSQPPESIGLSSCCATPNSSRIIKISPRSPPLPYPPGVTPGPQNLWQTIRTLSFPSPAPTAMAPTVPPDPAQPISSPSTLKTRCAGRISTTPCRSSSGARCPTSATASSPSIAAFSTPCTRWACSRTRSTPSAPRSSARPWASTIPTATPPSTTRWSAWRSPSACAIPLVDGQGNFGSVDGDPPAAMRYTECRLEKHRRRDARRHRHGHRRLRPQLRRVHLRALRPARAHSQPHRQRRRTASPSAWRPTSRRTTSPRSSTPPSRGRTIPHAGLDLEVVSKHVKGPDFPTGGFIYGKSGIAQAYKTGRGRFLMRAKCAIENITRRPPGDHRHRDPLPGQQVHPHQAHRRAGQRQSHRRHHATFRDESRPRRHAHRHRAQARRRSPDRPQPALQAHPDAGELLA